MKKSSLLITIVLAALAALAPFAIDTYLPAFQTLAQEFETSNLQIQQSLTAYLLPYCAMTLLHGAISDAIGRLRTIYLGLSAFVLASIGCALSPNVEMFWFFRVLQGLSAGAGNVVARAMVRDLFEGIAAQRVMAQLQMMFAIAPAVAPIIGSWLLGIHWQVIFLFLAVYGLLALLSARYTLYETVAQDKRTTLSPARLYSQYQQAFSDPQYRRLITAFAANFSGFFLYVLAAPMLLIQHLNLLPTQFWMLFIPTVTGTILGSLLARQLAGILPGHTQLRLGYGVMAAAAVFNIAVCWIQPVSPWWYIAPIAVYNIGMAAALPLLSLAALDRLPRLRGTAASGQAFMQMLLSTVSAGLLIPLVWQQPLGLAVTMVLYLLAGAICASRTHLWQYGREEARA